MNNGFIVGLTGYAGAGKDEVGKCFVAAGYRRVAFADALKTTARKLGWDGNKDDRGRRFLQLLGEAMRVLDPEYWIKQAARAMSRPLAAGNCFVITDVRYVNEAEWIRKNGGVIIRVVRPLLGPANNHVSELEMEAYNCDASIYNDGTLSDLAAEVDEIRGALEMGLSLDSAPVVRSMYIAGPMTKYRDSDWNYAAFDAAASELRALGFDVYNPAEAFDRRTDLPRKVYMRKCVSVLPLCDAVVLLPGWEESKGAQCEKFVAEQLEIPVVEYNGDELHKIIARNGVTQ